MTAEVDDGFFQLFERRIFVRGEAYYDAGKVDPPVMIAENLWHTVVRGNDDYQVDIRLRHGKVISAAAHANIPNVQCTASMWLRCLSSCVRADVGNWMNRKTKFQSFLMKH